MKMGHAAPAFCPHRRNGAEADGKPVPGIDGRNQHRQVDRLGFGEMGADFLIDLIRRMGLRDQRHRFRPCQCGALAVSIDRRFAPGIEQIEALLGFAALARILGVHVDAEGATVDL